MIHHHHKKHEEVKDYDKRVYREWNTVDFVGKFHLARFKEKLTPLPGTQTAIEQEYVEDVKKFYERMDEKVEERHKKSEHKQKVKQESSQFRTKVFFDTVIGGPMAAAEKLLNEREQLLLNEHKPPVDDLKSINKFIANCELNRAHYVGYAASIGFQSMNYQHPVSGNTALHLTVRKGLIETVNELLKYKADPDVKNKLGNHPIHECWMFWKTNANRTKEERLEQEEKTCKLLLAILSYNGSVDAPDVRGQTALHIACRLGPVQAVKTILSFKADYLLCMHDGKSPQDLALEFGNEEIYKLLNSWSLIRKHLVNLDFHMVWHRFLKDYEAVITSHKSAEAILTEIHMEVNIRQLERDSSYQGVPIEDALLSQAYKDHRNIVEIIPKPWEPGWAAYVKHCQDAGVVDLKSKLDELTKRKKGAKKAKTVKKLFSQQNYLPDRPTPLPRPRLLHSLTTDEQPSNRSPSRGEGSTKSSQHHGASLHYSSSGSGSASGSSGRNKLPSLSNDLAHGSLMSSVTGATILEGDESEEEEDEESVKGVALVKGKSSRSVGDAKTTGSKLALQTQQGSDENGEGGEAVAAEEQEDEAEEQEMEEDSSPRDFYAVKKRYNTPPHKASQNTTELDKRRRKLVHSMLGDAKFLKFTTRLSHNSALLIPLRAPEAPMDGTAEEHSIMRRIVSQGPEFEKFNKFKKVDRYSELMGIKNEIPINSIGAYYRAADYMVPSDRDKLYESLTDKQGIRAVPTAATLNALASAAEARAGSVSEDVAPISKKEMLDREAIANHAKVVDLMTAHKIDLVDDKRPRYVKADLLPAKREVSVVEQMAAKKREADTKELRAKVGLSSESSVAAARAEMEAKIAQSALDAAGAGTGGGGGDEVKHVELGMKDLFNSKKKEEEKNLSVQNMFLRKETVKYGAGRITSTHNSMGKIEEPWSTVGGRYKTVAGDRTA